MDCSSVLWNQISSTVPASWKRALNCSRLLCEAKGEAIYIYNMVKMMSLAGINLNEILQSSVCVVGRIIAKLINFLLELAFEDRIFTHTFPAPPKA